MKRVLVAILICISFCRLYAIENFVAQWIQDAIALGYTPEAEIANGNYVRMRMADSCYIDILRYPDSLLVVRTVCAPVCSSTAAIYSPNGQIIRDVQPVVDGIFPLAHIEDGNLTWTDNTTEILDDSERNRTKN